MIYLVRFNPNNRPSYEMYGYYTEYGTETLTFKVDDKDYTIKRNKCDGTWQEEPLPAFYFLSVEKALEWKGFLLRHAYLEQFIKSLPKVPVTPQPGKLFRKYNAEQVMVEIVELWTALLERGFPVLTTAKLLKECVAALGLSRSKFPDLYAVSVTMRAADVVFLDEMAGVTKNMGSHQKGTLRRELLHALVSRAKNELKR